MGLLLPHHLKQTANEPALSIKRTPNCTQNLCQEHMVTIFSCVWQSPLVTHKTESGLQVNHCSFRHGNFKKSIKKY